MFLVTAFYKFCPIAAPRIGALKDEIASFCKQKEIRGLFLLSVEGCNATMSGSPDAISQFQQFLQSIPEFGIIPFKDSEAAAQPFRRLKIDVREEIVTLKRPDIIPPSGQNHHLSPREWHQMVTSNEDILLIDTRNEYETEIGTFRGAVDPKIKNFAEFPQYVQDAAIPKDKKILMYCTGGIRCEKALVFMQQEGFKNVFQLDGGILNYLKEFPEGEFAGECFVFDHRVAVDGHLQPTKKYRLCPHCGNPAKEDITCIECGAKAIVCHHCLDVPEQRTCSKNCAYHAKLDARNAQG